MAAVSTKFLLTFAPEQWSPARRLRFFIGPPFLPTRALMNAVFAAESHRQKIDAFATLLGSLRDGLIKDAEEVDQTGYTPASRAKQYTAVAETVILELYSCLDALRAAIFFTHRSIQGVQNKSTSRLFSRAHECSYGPGFPDQVRTLLATAYHSWFQELRRIRVELSHGDIGYCHLDRATGRVTYAHRALGTDTRALVIEDFESKLNSLAFPVFALLDRCFEHLCSRLEPIEHQLPCGFFRGRVYERIVSHEPNLSRHSGRCYSKQWFHSEPGCECPLRNDCEAFGR